MGRSFQSQKKNEVIRFVWQEGQVIAALTADNDTLLPLNFLLENKDGHKLHFFKVKENHYRGKIFHKAKTKTKQAMSKQERESL